MSPNVPEEDQGGCRQQCIFWLEKVILALNTNVPEKDQGGYYRLFNELTEKMKRNWLASVEGIDHRAAALTGKVSSLKSGLEAAATDLQKLTLTPNPPPALDTAIARERIADVRKSLELRRDQIINPACVQAVKSTPPLPEDFKQKIQAIKARILPIYLGRRWWRAWWRAHDGLLDARDRLVLAANTGKWRLANWKPLRRLAQAAAPLRKSAKTRFQQELQAGESRPRWKMGDKLQKPRQGLAAWRPFRFAARQKPAPRPARPPRGRRRVLLDDLLRIRQAETEINFTQHRDEDEEKKIQHAQLHFQKEAGKDKIGPASIRPAISRFQSEIRQFLKPPAAPAALGPRVIERSWWRRMTGWISRPFNRISNLEPPAGKPS